MHIFITLVAALLLTTAAARADIGTGSTREEVLARFGKPASESVQGPLTTMVYPLGTVRLRDGQVTEITPKLLQQGGPAAGTGLRMPGAAGGSKVIKKGSGRLDLKSVLVPGKITMVDFYADWCGPCKRLGPILTDLAKADPDVYLIKVDIGDFESPVADQFALRGIPHVRVYGRDGQQVGAGSSMESTIRRNIEAAKSAPALAPAPGG